MAVHNVLSSSVNIPIYSLNKNSTYEQLIGLNAYIRREWAATRGLGGALNSALLSAPICG